VTVSQYAKVKDRMVVDIRNLNKISEPDVYPVPLQTDVIAMMAGKKFISVIDCMTFFYQWRIWPPHWNRVTIVSHRGQEVMKVALMGYRNSVSYVQRMIDSILRKYHRFCFAYIDDVFTFSEDIDS
jgi:hypothetical protein